MINDIEGLEIKIYDGHGYKEQIDYNGWRVAIANYKPELERDKLTFLERHLETDEVFVLIEGTAGLLVGEKLTECQMTMGKLYNITCGTWHRVFMKPGAKVVIIENANTGIHNTEYMEMRLL